MKISHFSVAFLPGFHTDLCIIPSTLGTVCLDM
jgi:hypothetical protein